MDWSILGSVVDTPFPHNLKIAGSNPLQRDKIFVTLEITEIYYPLAPHTLNIQRNKAD